MNKNLYSLSNSKGLMKIDEGKRNRKASYYCCYQNFLLCCESEILQLSSDKDKYNEIGCFQNPYENVMIVSGNYMPLKLS